MKKGLLLVLKMFLVLIFTYYSFRKNEIFSVLRNEIMYILCQNFFDVLIIFI